MPTGVSGQGQGDNWNYGQYSNGNVQTNGSQGTDTSNLLGTGWTGKDSAQQSTQAKQTGSTNAGAPSLPAPKDSKDGKDNKTSAPPSPAPGTGTTAQGTMDPLDIQYHSDFDKLVQDALHAMNLAPDQFNDDLEMAHFIHENPDAEVPDKYKALKAAVKTAEQKAAKQVKDENPKATSWTAPKDNAQKFNGIYEKNAQSALLELQTSKKPPMSKGDVAKLAFALYHPELSDESVLKGDDMAHLQELIAARMSKDGYALPPGWKPDSSDVDAQIASPYNKNFTTQLLSYASKNNLTDTEQNELRAMHSGSKIDFADKAKLAPILAEIEKKAMNAASLELNLPSSIPATWRPPQIDAAANFEKTIQENYQVDNEMNLQDAINKAQPPLSKNDIQLLRTVISDPNSTGIPDNIRKLASDITAKSLSQVKADFGLPATWAPTGAALWSGSTKSLNALEFSKQMDSAIDKLMAEIPDGPDKQALIDILKQIKDALNYLQQSICDIEVAKSSSQRNQQLAMKDAADMQAKITQSQLDTQRQQQDDMAAKQHDADAKQQKMGLIMKIVQPITIALTAVALVLAAATLPESNGLGLVAVAVLTVLLISEITDAADPNAHVMTNIVNGLGFAFKALAMWIEKGCPVPSPLSADDIWQSQDKAACIVGQVFGTIIIILLTLGGASAGGGGAASASSAAGDVATTAGETASAAGNAAAAGSTAGEAASASGDAVEAGGEAASNVAKTSEEAAKDGAESASNAGNAAGDAGAGGGEVGNDAGTMFGRMFDEGGDIAGNAADSADDAEETAKSVMKGLEKIEEELEEGDDVEVGLEEAEKTPDQIRAERAANRAANEENSFFNPENDEDASQAKDFQRTMDDRLAAKATPEQLAKAKLFAKVSTVVGAGLQAYDSTNLTQYAVHDIYKNTDEYRRRAAENQQDADDWLDSQTNMVSGYFNMALTIGSTIGVGLYGLANSGAITAAADEELRTTQNLIEDLKDKADKTISDYLKLLSAYARQFIINDIKGLGTEGSQGSRIINFSKGASDIVIGVLNYQATQIQADMQRMQGDQAKTKAELDKTNAEFNNYVQNIQGLIKEILKVLTSLTQWNESVGETQSNMWKDLRVDFAG